MKKKTKLKKLIKPKIENSLAQTKKSLYLKPQVADEGKKEEYKGQLEKIVQYNPHNVCEILWRS